MINDMFKEMNELAEKLGQITPEHELLRFNSASVGSAVWTAELRSEFLNRFGADNDSTGAGTLGSFVLALKEALGEELH